jgi:hypothetical protein
MAPRMTTLEEIVDDNATTVIGSKRCVRFTGETSYRASVTSAGEEIDLCCPSTEDHRCRVRVEAELLKPKGFGVLLKNCFVEKDKTSQKHINAFSQLPGNDYPRGLEVYLSRQHRETLDDIHRKVIQGVLRRQRTLTEADTPYDVICEKLRSISKKHSRSSRIFARRLGLADARAVREGDDHINAFMLVKELNKGNAKMAQRKASTEDMSSAGKQGGLPHCQKVFGLAFIASQRNQTSPPRKLDRVPGHVPVLSARCSATACSEVIQDTLDLLEFSSEDECSYSDLDVDCTEAHVVGRVVARTA